MRIQTANSNAAILSEFGGRIKRARIDQQLTQQALATKTGVSLRTISVIENGGDLRLGICSTFCELLGIWKTSTPCCRNWRSIQRTMHPLEKNGSAFLAAAESRKKAPGHGVTKHDDRESDSMGHANRNRCPSGRQQCRRLPA